MLILPAVTVGSQRLLYLRLLRPRPCLLKRAARLRRIARYQQAQELLRKYRAAPLLSNTRTPPPGPVEALKLLDEPVGADPDGPAGWVNPNAELMIDVGLVAPDSPALLRRHWKLATIEGTSWSPRQILETDEAQRSNSSTQTQRSAAEPARARLGRFRPVDFDRDQCAKNIAYSSRPVYKEAVI